MKQLVDKSKSENMNPTKYDTLTMDTMHVSTEADYKHHLIIRNLQIEIVLQF